MIDTTQGMAQPERARFLKERFLSRRPSICLEGALAKTRAFRETEGEALIVRRAKGFRRHCETKTIAIDPRELIVGHPGCRVAQRGHLPRAVQHVAVRGVRPYARARSGSL